MYLSYYKEIGYYTGWSSRTRVVSDSLVVLSGGCVLAEERGEEVSGEPGQRRGVVDHNSCSLWRGGVHFSTLKGSKNAHSVRKSPISLNISLTPIHPPPHTHTHHVYCKSLSPCHQFFVNLRLLGDHHKDISQVSNLSKVVYSCFRSSITSPAHLSIFHLFTCHLSPICHLSPVSYQPLTCPQGRCSHQEKHNYNWNNR